MSVELYVCILMQLCLFGLVWFIDGQIYSEC